jgi:hypothetical protein
LGIAAIGDSCRTESSNIRVLQKGNIFQKIGIVIALGVLAWLSVAIAHWGLKIVVEIWNWTPEIWTAVGIVGAGIGLLLFAYLTYRLQRDQLKLLNMNIRSSTFSTIESRVHDLNQFLIDYPEIGRRLDEPFSKPKDDTDHRADDYADILLTFFEELFYQYHSYGLLDKEIWDMWEQVIKDYMDRKKYLYGHLDDYNVAYSERLKKFLYSLRSCDDKSTC